MAWINLSVLLGSLVFFAGPADAGLKARTLQACSQLALKKMSCILTTSTAEVKFDSSGATAVTAGQHSSLELPVQGAGTEWENIQLLEAAGRLFVQFLVWGAPSGADQQQELHWFVFEVADGKFVPRVMERSIQTRAPAAEDEESGEFKRTHGERIAIEQDETGRVFAVRGKARQELR